MSISGRVGIIGFPVAHSLSPKIHNAALQSLGLDISYELWKTSEKNLDERIEMLRAPDILGANVTVPFKQKIIPFLDDLEGFAKEIGAVNTIIKRNGLLIGKNTDAEGFVIPLEKELNKLQLDFSQVRTLLIGAGGASRAIAFALAKAGIPNITIMNRTLESAKELAQNNLSYSVAEKSDKMSMEKLPHKSLAFMSGENKNNSIMISLKTFCGKGTKFGFFLEIYIF